MTDIAIFRYSQRSQLPYMEAFIQETLRFNCSVPGMWRNTAQDATYEVIHFDDGKASFFFINIISVNKRELTDGLRHSFQFTLLSFVWNRNTERHVGSTPLLGHE